MEALIEFIQNLQQQTSSAHAAAKKQQVTAAEQALILQGRFEAAQALYSKLEELKTQQAEPDNKPEFED